MTDAPRLSSPEDPDCPAAIAAIAARGTASTEELQALTACLGAVRKAVQRQAAETFRTLVARGLAVRDILLNAVRANDARLRWGACYALSLQGEFPPQALPVLLECLGDDDGDVRWAAANILVRMHDHVDASEALRGLLRTGNNAQRKMAAYCLRDLDARSVSAEQALISALTDPDAGVRLAAVSALTRLTSHQPSAAQPIVALLTDGDPGVRRAAAAALGSLGDSSEPILSALRAAASSTDSSLQRAAERSLRLLQS